MSTTPSKSSKVLFVDDDPSFLFAIAKTFTGGMFIIHTASSFPAAIRMIEKHFYKAVVTDFNFKNREQSTGMDIIGFVKLHSPGTTTILWSAQFEPSSLLSDKTIPLPDYAFSKSSLCEIWEILCK